MQDNKFNIKGQFGNDDNDIEYAYVLAKAENKFEAIYIKYNNGDIKKIAKPEKQSSKDFSQKVNIILKKIGATNRNRKTRWNVLKRNNHLGVNFDYLENTYQNQLMSDDIISFNVNKKTIKPKKRFKIVKVDKLADLEELEDEYAIYKVKAIRNLLVAAAIAFATFSPIEGPWSYFNLKNNLVYTVDILLLLSAVIDGIIMYGNQKIRKKIESSM